MHYSLLYTSIQIPASLAHHHSPPTSTTSPPMAATNQTPNHRHKTQPPPHNINWLSRFKYQKPQDPHNNTRNVLLVVSALIAAVTFQAGVNPPGGVWQDGHRAGSAIYAARKKPFYVFLVFNTLALSSAISVIISLTFMFPFSVEIWIATVSMIVTYGSCVFAIVPPHGNYRFRYLLITAAFPVVARVCVEICRYVKRKKYPELSYRDLVKKLCRVSK